MDKYTGKRLDGRYEIQELIGVGGMAMVYKAYDNVDDKTVAIKILKDEFLGNDEFIRRFKNESKAIAVLSHPNIVKVYDVSFGDRIQYIVMEYIDGITLKEYIGQQKVLPWKEAVHFTVQILQALQHAHEKGIVHRDVKPQNIILLQDGTIKVTDFGIARFSNKETRTMTDKAIGSVHYIAPEQARGEVTDGKTDVYSVGVMMYEMLTGTLPFEAESAVSVAIMQLQNEPKPLREINDEIPGGIEDITLKAMRKDPKQRYASASEMLEAIEVFRNDPSVRFNYNYFVDEVPTKYVGSLNNTGASNTDPIYDDNYDSNDYEIVASRSKTVVKWVTITTAILVVAAIIIFIVMIVKNAMSRNEVPDVDVPNFMGMSIDEIRANKDYKFQFEIVPDFDKTKPENVVLSQNPEADSKKIKENAVIKLVINSEETKTEVPKVKNYLEQEAIDKIEEKNLVCDIQDVQRVYSSEVAKGYVIDCAPQEGTEQEIRTHITLIVSAGPAPEQVEVPNVVGSSYESAKADLEALGFTTQKANVASALDAGKVIGTDPLAGNSLTKGYLITIQVSDGSKKVSAISYDLGSDLPQNEYAKINVKVILNETNGQNSQLYEADLIPAEGGKLTIELDPKGAKNNQKFVTVMIDGIKYESLTFDFKTHSVSRTYINSNYTVKSSRDPLDDRRSEAAAEIDNYPDRSDYTESNKKSVEKIINKYIQNDGDNKGLIYAADSEEEITSLVEQAKSEIDAVPKKSDSSKPENSPEPSDTNQSSTEESLSFDDLKRATIEQITAVAQSRYYSDDNWAKIEALLEEYTSKISSAQTENEVYALNLEAERRIAAVPALGSSSG